jgi:TrmH family RNA methyltransferase
MRAAESAFVVEGVKLLSAALDCGLVPESVYVAQEALCDERVSRPLERARMAGAATYLLAPGVIERVSDTVSPQPVMAVVRSIDVALDEVASGSGPVVVCVGVRDPGNAGTIVRSAAGADFAGVVFCEGSVDPYNPKTVRATAGSLFQVPLVSGVSAGEAVSALRQKGFRLVGAEAHGGRYYADCDLAGRVALLIGNESQGVDPAVAASFDEVVTIPLARGVESLNAGIAAAILCFEALRQKRREGVAA